MHKRLAIPIISLALAIVLAAPAWATPARSPYAAAADAQIDAQACLQLIFNAGGASGRNDWAGIQRFAQQVDATGIASYSPPLGTRHYSPGPMGTLARDADHWLKAVPYGGNSYPPAAIAMDCWVLGITLPSACTHGCWWC